MRPPLDLRNERFGKLVAREYLGGSLWRCDCDCGKTATIRASNLRSGNSKSCGQCFSLTRPVTTDKPVDHDGTPRPSTVTFYEWTHQGMMDRRIKNVAGIAVWVDYKGRVLAVSHKMVRKRSQMDGRILSSLEETFMNDLANAGHIRERRTTEGKQRWVKAMMVTMKHVQARTRNSDEHDTVAWLESMYSDLWPKNRDGYLERLRALPSYHQIPEPVDLRSTLECAHDALAGVKSAPSTPTPSPAPQPTPQAPDDLDDGSYWM